MLNQISTLQGKIARRIGSRWRRDGFWHSPTASASTSGAGFDLEDAWNGEALISQRTQLAHRWLRGNGIEIGALHSPVDVPESATVRYVDYKTLEENRERYPELSDQRIVTTDLIDDGFILRRISERSLDFIVANHALEHSPNPYGTLRSWGAKLAERGVLFVAVPIADTCYDRGRPITSLAHLLADDRAFQDRDVPLILRGTVEHVVEFLAISDRYLRLFNKQPIPPWREVLERAEQLVGDLEVQINAAVAEADKSGSQEALAELSNALVTCHVQYLNRVYDVHYHTFSPRSYHDFLRSFCDSEGFRLEALRKSGSGECIGILRKL